MAEGEGSIMFSQAELKHLMGTSRESFNKHTWPRRREKWIRITCVRVWIPNKEALRNLSVAGGSGQKQVL